MRRLALAALTVALAASTARGDDWPQFQGPRGDGTSPERILRIHDEKKPTLNLCDFTMPVLSRGRLLVRTPEELICYDGAGK